MKSTSIENRLRGFISIIAILAAILCFDSVVYTQIPGFSLSARAGRTDWKQNDLLSKNEFQQYLYDNMFLVVHQVSGENLKLMDPGNGNNVELIGRWADGPCEVVAVKRDTVYFGNGGYLEIVDFSEPTNPVELGKALVPGPIEAVTVNGSYAYIADDTHGLRIIDISDPGSPFETGYFDTGGRSCDVAAREGHVYVADREEGLRVIDVSDPTNPFEVGYFDTNEWAIGVAVSGGYTYVADGPDGLRVIDVSDPTNTFEAGYYMTSGFANEVAVTGSYAYVADGSAGLRVIDISNPTNPFGVGHCNTSNYADEVVVSGDYVYVADWEAGLRVIDVSDPTNPFETGYCIRAWYTMSVAVYGSYAYVANWQDGLGVIDVSNPTNPFEAGSFETGGCAKSVVADGDYAYVADGYAGLRVIDISDMTNPVPTGHFDTGGFAECVVLNGSYAYLGDFWNGLWVIDVSDPSNPFKVGYLSTVVYSNDLVLRGDYVYMAEGYKGLCMIDVSDPTNPSVVGYFKAGDSGEGIDVSGNYAYLANRRDGLRVIDISDPTKPFESGFYNTNGWANGVAVNGDYAYVADSWEGLRIIDVSDPANPFESGYFDTIGEAYNVTISGSYAYVAADRAGLRVINVFDPTNPFEAGYYDTGHWARDVTVSDGYAYLADANDGFYILRYVAAAGWDITGRIAYYSNDDPISNTLVKANNYSDTTDSNGEYELLNLPTDNYIARPEQENDASDAISAYDAAWILQYGVEQRTFTPYQMIAGDVSGNGSVSAFDAAKILQYGVGLINQFPVMEDSTHFWRFVPQDFAITSSNWTTAPDSIAYTPLNSDATGNYYGIIYGDVSGNWYPSSMASLASLGKSSSETVDIRLEDISGEKGDKAILPVVLENGSDILAISFTLEYDARVLKALSASTSELTENWQMAHNIKQGQIKVALAGSKPITTSGAMANLEFKVLGTQLDEASSPLNISEITINEGNIDVNIQSAKFTTGTALPKEYTLSQNYPNPFNAQTLIKYQLPQTGRVVLKIYNTLGQEVRTLVDEEKKAGYHGINWDGRNDDGVYVTSGIYMYRLQAGDFVKVKKISFIR